MAKLIAIICKARWRQCLQDKVDILNPLGVIRFWVTYSNSLVILTFGY